MENHGNDHDLYGERLEEINARVDQLYPDGKVIFSAYEEDDNGLPIDNLDDIAVEGDIILYAEHDPFFGKGKDFYSDRITSPTWMQVVGLANEAVACTGDEHHVFLEILHDTGDIRDGARIIEIYFGS